jgi:TPR repeat protein
VALIESAAGAGIAEAQFALALIMNPPDVDPPSSCPDGTTKALRAISRERCADAIRWLRRAALQGHRQAANCLGLHYLLAGVKGKKGAALRWLRIAARSGLAEGMMNLAKAHAEAAADSDGGGGEASAGVGGGALAEQQAEQLQYSLALKWCRRAARADCPEAFLALGRFHKKGVPEVLAADGAKAMSYFRAAARRGCAEAAMELGSCYYAGEGVEADFQKAFEWFQHGAKAGDACCMFRLADLYEAGIGVKKSKHTALGWYNKGSFAMQMCKGGPSPGPPAEGLSEMSTWEGLESMAKRSGGDGGRGDEQDANEQGEDEDDEARAEREKFEAWCKISTPRQIALFHKIQADLDAAA